MAAHTPGPYSVDVTNEVRWADSYALIILAPDGKTPVGVASDFNRTDRDDEKRANARLFAAAPELLAALERIVLINGSTGGHKAMVAEFKHIARTAIAKAGGDR